MYIKEVEGDFDKLLFPVQAGELTDALASSVDDYMFAAGCLLDFAYGEL